MFSFYLVFTLSKRWIINCRRIDFLKRDADDLNKNARLCSDHFEEEMFADNTKKSLTTVAIPTLFDVPNPPPKIGTKRRLIFRQDTSVGGREMYILKLHIL